MGAEIGQVGAVFGVCLTEVVAPCARSLVVVYVRSSTQRVVGLDVGEVEEHHIVVECVLPHHIVVAFKRCATTVGVPGHQDETHAGVLCLKRCDGVEILLDLCLGIRGLLPAPRPHRVIEPAPVPVGHGLRRQKPSGCCPIQALV